MADGACNSGKGRTVEYYNRVKSNDPATAGFVLVLLQVNEVETALIDHATLALMLAAANTEATFTNYVRKVLTDTELATLPTPDSGNDYITLDLPDQTWTAAGGGTNNTLTKAIICYAPDTGGADTTFIPVSHQDFTVTTDSSDVILNFNAAGWYRSA